MSRRARLWYPPGSLIGPHWQIQLKHVVTDEWVTYTEHATMAAANALADRSHLVVGTDRCRVVEVVP